MPNFNFAETVKFFGEKIQKSPPSDDIQAGEVEIIIDHFPIVISKGKFEGSLALEILLGLYVKPIHEERLKELATSNFLNINTGGCTLALDDVSISLKCVTTSGTSPQENWEWMHRILSVAREWHTVLRLWEEFVPLIFREEKYE